MQFPNKRFILFCIGKIQTYVEFIYYKVGQFEKKGNKLDQVTGNFFCEESFKELSMFSLVGEKGGI